MPATTGSCWPRVILTASIRIKTYAQNNFAVIEIVDTGQGIPEQNLRRIFDPGFTTKGVGTGMGLGLAIAYRIVQDHGGSIEVISAVNRGTAFTIRLPIAPEGSPWRQQT